MNSDTSTLASIKLQLSICLLLLQQVRFGGHSDDNLIIFFRYFLRFHIPIPIPGISGFSGFFFRDFFGIFQRFKNPDPDPRDFGIFGIFLSGFFRDFQIPIPIPGISGFSGFFDLAQNKKSRSRIPGIGIRDSGSRKNPIPKQTLI